MLFTDVYYLRNAVVAVTRYFLLRFTAERLLVFHLGVLDLIFYGRQI